MGSLHTSIQYLARDTLYETEKPYSADFEVRDRSGAKKSNYLLSTQEVSINPIEAPDEFDIDTHGFCVVKAPTNLTADDALNRPREVETAYLDEIEAILHQKFPEYRRLEGIEFVVRKRDQQFPSDRLALVDFEQPACLAHSDFSVEGAKLQVKASFPGQDYYFEDKEFDLLNVWRPLLGPNNDWPLAVCDYTSIEPDRDIALADVLHRDRFTENMLLRPNERHRWYYVQDQQPDDLIVFRNVDSTGKRARGFHCAFPNPQSQGPPRTSCEVRFVAIR